MPRPQLRIAVAAALTTFTLALTAAGAAAAPPATVADALAANWAARQHSDGSFPDSLRPTAHGWGRYGEAGLGYGLILAGVRTGRADLAQAGARAQLYAIENAPDRSSVFESMMLASGYNQLRLRAPATPAFQQRRSEWEGYLRTIAPLFNARIDAPYLSSNKYLVEAVLGLELARSGLRSSAPNATLSSPRTARRRALDVINRLVPQRVRMLRAEAAGQRITALSDRYAEPAAYHALVLGFLARAIDLAGPRATNRARESLRTGVRTTWAFQAPDGDLAYFGRSQDQAWALAASAFAAERAAGPSCDRQARALLAVEDRALARIDARHPIGPNGMPIVPSANGPASVKAIDNYAGDVVYNGLALTMLGWAADGTIARPGCKPGRLLADRRRSGARLPFELARFATGRRGRVWMAVKQRSQGSDPRAAFGLRALKYRAGDGSWIDLIPGAPIDAGAPGSTLGPALVGRHGRLGRPEGAHMRFTRRLLLVDGGWVIRHRHWIRRTVFRFVPTARGVRVVVPVKKGDRVRYSALTAGRPQVLPDGVAGAVATTRASAPASVVVRGPYASSSSLDVWRSDIEVRARAKRVTFTVAAR